MPDNQTNAPAQDSNWSKIIEEAVSLLNPSIAIGNLTHEEYRTFEKSTIHRTGDTGIDATPEQYNAPAPYFGTYLNELPAIMTLLGWMDVKWVSKDGELFALKGERK